MTDTDAVRDDIIEQLSDHGVDADPGDIDERLNTLIGEYSIPANEAKRSVINHYAKESGEDIGTGGSGPVQMDIADVDTSENWVTIEGTITQLWGDNHETIKQAGRIGDETGTIKFTSWENAEQPLVEEDKSYRFDNVGTDEWQGQMQVNFTEYTTVTELDESIEANEQTTELIAPLVDIKSGSGLIKRCDHDDCTFVVQNGRCQDHGEVDGEFDLRIKAIFDDGNEPQDVLFNAEATTELTGVTLEDAIERAQEMLDTTVIADDFVEQLVGQYFQVEGPTMGRYLLANECETVHGPSTDTVNELRARVRSL